MKKIVILLTLAVCLLGAKAAYANADINVETRTPALGQTFTVTLDQNATTGFSWLMVQNPDKKIVSLISDTYVAPNSKLVGASGKRTWKFKAHRSGQTTIRLWYAKWWDPTQTPTMHTINVISGKPIPVKKSTTVYYSAQDATTFCNGADMKTDDFRNTVTKTKTLDITTATTQSNVLKAVAVAVTTGQMQQALKQASYTVSNGTVTVSGLEGWAGSSIAMCSGKPLVEVNFLHQPGIKAVVWK